MADVAGSTTPGSQSGAGTGVGRVSVAMATYNGARWLGDQLGSFAAQTRLPDELVVTDDGSTDDTAAVVAAFAATAPFPVRFERNPARLGFNGNFARAIGLATGDIIFISDQDDVWYPDKIARVAAVLDGGSDWLAVVNDQAIADQDGRETGGTVLGNVRAMGRPDGWYGPGCCTAFSARLLPLLQPFAGDVVAYDHWINTLADALGRRCVVEAPLQMYRRHGGNASGSVFALERPDWRALVRAARRGDAQTALTAKVAELGAIVERLERSERAAALARPEALAAGLTALRAERADYVARRDLPRGRVRRAVGVVRLLTQARYRRFSGVATALKDLVS